MKCNVTFSVHLTDNEIHPVNFISKISAVSNLIQEEFFEAELLKSVYENNLPSLKEATNQWIRGSKTIGLHIQIIASIVIVVFCVVRSLAVAVLLEILCIKRSLSGIFPENGR